MLQPLTFLKTYGLGEEGNRILAKNESEKIWAGKTITLVL